MEDRDIQFKKALQASVIKRDTLRLIEENNKIREDLKNQAEQAKTPVETRLKIKQLADKYYVTWKREVNFNVIPAELTVERCIHTLERIILTGETFLTGYNCLYRQYIYQNRPYMYNMVASAYQKPSVIKQDDTKRSFRVDGSSRTDIIRFRAKNKLNGNIWH